MNEMSFFSKSEDMTKKIAAMLANQLDSGDVITLSGNLGAGKTTFTKGLAAELGIKRAVTSPTFTIMKEYKGRIPLYHIDAYRLEDSEEDIGFEEYLEGDGVTVIEWAHFIEHFLPQDRLEIIIDYHNETSRSISLQAKGEHYVAILDKLNFPKESSQ